MPLSNLIYIISVLQHGMESAGFVEEIVRGKFHFFCEICGWNVNVRTEGVVISNDKIKLNAWPLQGWSIWFWNLLNHFQDDFFPTSFGNQHILFRTLPLNMSDLIIFPTRFSSINIIHPESGANVTYLCNGVSDSRWWPPLVGSVPLPRMIYKGNCKKNIYKTKLKTLFRGKNADFGYFTFRFPSPKWWWGVLNK